MVDAEQHRTHRRYPLGVPDLDALKEKPDPEPRDHPHDGVEGVHYSLVLRSGDTAPFRALRAAANVSRPVPVQTLLPDATMPSPHPDDEHRRERQEAGETEPALCPVHIGHDGFDLIREEVSQPERQRDAEYGGARVRHYELPERDARTARGQKRGGAESHDVPRRDDRLQCMPSIRCLQPLLPRERQYEPDQSPVEDLLTPVPADPVEHHVAG